MVIENIHLLLKTLDLGMDVSYKSLNRAMFINTTIINKLTQFTEMLSAHQTFIERVLATLTTDNDQDKADKIKQRYLITHQMICDHKRDIKTTYETLRNRHMDLAQVTINRSHEILQTVLKETIPENFILTVNTCILTAEQELEKIEQLYSQCHVLSKQMEQVEI